MGLKTDLTNKERASYKFWKARLDTALKLLEGTPVFDQLAKDPDLEWIYNEVNDAVEAVANAARYIEAGAEDFS